MDISTILKLTGENLEVYKFSYIDDNGKLNKDVELNPEDIFNNYGCNFGYPVILKAGSGGGGKGIRVIKNRKELIANFPIVKQEVKNSFGNENIYLEKFFDIKNSLAK